VEDAFQARTSFLFTERKTIRQRQALGGWLSASHRVAFEALAGALGVSAPEQQSGRRRLKAGPVVREAWFILHEELTSADQIPVAPAAFVSKAEPRTSATATRLHHRHPAREAGTRSGALACSATRGGVTLSAGLLAACGKPRDGGFRAISA